MDPQRLRKLSHAGGPDRYGMEISAKREVAYDADIRKALDHVAVGLAEHLRDSMLRGERPDGRGRLPAKNASAPGPPWVGVRTGYMARNFVLSTIRGGEEHAERTIAPNDKEEGRRRALESMAAQGVQVCTTQGRAGEVVRKRLAEAAAAAIGQLRTPARPRLGGGLLPQVSR